MFFVHLSSLQNKGALRHVAISLQLLLVTGRREDWQLIRDDLMMSLTRKIFTLIKFILVYPVLSDEISRVYLCFHGKRTKCLNNFQIVDKLTAGSSQYQYLANVLLPQGIVMVDVKIIHPIVSLSLFGLGCTKPCADVSSESCLHLRAG